MRTSLSDTRPDIGATFPQSVSTAGPRPSTGTGHSSRNSTPVVMVVLFAGSFIMGSAEELVFGMLDLIAEGLRVSIPSAGALVTANALGLMIGGPLLAWSTSSWDRRTVLVVTIAIFGALNLVPVLVDDYPIVLGTRVLVGATQGWFIAAAIVTATSLVSPERAGRAMTVVISGFGAASALGMPAFTFLGQQVGWRTSFFATVVLAGIVLVAALLVLPAIPATSKDGATGTARHAFAPRVVGVLALCVLTFAALQTTMTYLVPLLGAITGVAGSAITGYLLLFGLSSLVGSVLGGRFADADASRALVLGTLGLGAALVTMFVAGHQPVPMALAVMSAGLCTGSNAPSLQHRVESLAGPGASLASSLPAPAMYAGIALGSVFGGVAIDHGGLTSAVLAGAGIAVLALVAAIGTRGLVPPSRMDAP